MTDELDVINHWKHRALTAEKKLKKIQDIVNEPCFDGEDCLTCKNSCPNRDILDVIQERGN